MVEYTQFMILKDVDGDVHSKELVISCGFFIRWNHYIWNGWYFVRI